MGPMATDVVGQKVEHEDWRFFFWWGVVTWTGCAGLALYYIWQHISSVQALPMFSAFMAGVAMGYSSGLWFIYIAASRLRRAKDQYAVLLERYLEQRDELATSTSPLQKRSTSHGYSYSR